MKTQRGTATLWPAAASLPTARSSRRRTRAWGQAAEHVRRNALGEWELGRSVPAPVTWVSNRQQPMAARIRWRVRWEARGEERRGGLLLCRVGWLGLALWIVLDLPTLLWS